MSGNHYNTKNLTRAERIWLYFGAAVIGIFLGICIVCCAAISTARAEENVRDIWIMCRPGSEVMIRMQPGKKHEATGAAVSGTKMKTDGKERSGWIHIVDANNETGDGWVFKGYVVNEEPQKVDADMVIIAGGRVNCRKWIGGKRNKWAKSGTTIRVFWMADGWAVTNKGYVQSRYLGK